MLKRTKTALLIFLAVLVGFFGLSNFSNAESDTSEIEVRVKHTLTVYTEHGTVSGTGNFSCNQSNTPCVEEDYYHGDGVTLSVGPTEDGYTFSGWQGGGCSGTDPCFFIMNSSKEITAKYTKQTKYFNLIVNVGTGGKVTGLGVNCSSPGCQKSFEEGEEVELKAEPNDGFSFASWSGCNSSNGNKCNITMSSNKNVTATFSVENTTTGHVNSPLCKVQAGQSSCEIDVSWNVSYPKGQTTLEKSPGNQIIGTSHSGSVKQDLYISDPINYYYYYLYNDGKFLHHDFSWASCVSGTKLSKFKDKCVREFSVIFDKNGGQGIMPPQVFEEDETKDLNENTFTHASGFFKEWNTGKYGDETSYVDQASFTMGSSDVTLHAIWMMGELSAPNCTIPIGANKCNTTVKWNVKNPISATTKVTTPQNITVGSGHSGTKSYSLNYGESRNFFLYNNGIELKVVQASATCSSDGIWSEAQNKCIKDETCHGCSITTSSNGCVIAPESDCVDSLFGTKKSFTITPEVKSPNTQEDYNISASGCGGLLSGNTYTTGTLNKNSPDCLITADCSVKTQKVVFKPNGGTGTMLSQYIQRNISASLNKNLFQKNGSAFKEWTTKQDGSGNSYKDQAIFHMGITDVNLYAQWSELGKSLKVEIEGSGSVTSNPTGIECPTDCEEGYNHNQKIELEASAFNDNSFSGWTGCNRVLEGNKCEVTLDENKTVKAKFVPVVVIMTPDSLEYDINPNTNIPFSYSVSTGLNPAECRLLDFEKEPLTQYQTANPISYISEPTSGSYGYFLECRNKNNSSLIATSPKIIVNVVVVSVIPSSTMGKGEPGSVYSFGFTPDSLPKEPERLYKASCQLLNNNKEPLTSWASVILGNKNSISYALPKATGDFGYYIRCKNDEYQPAQATSAKITITSACEEDYQLDENGTCAKPTFHVSDGCEIESQGHQCLIDITWNIYQGEGDWAITSNTPVSGNIVVYITGSNRYSGKEGFYIYGTENHQFFLYNDGKLIESKLSKAYCEKGTLWNREKNICDIPLGTIEVGVCEISENKNTCESDIVWKFYDGIEDLGDGDICVRFNETEKCVNEGEMEEETFYYGENTLKVFVEGKQIKESYHAAYCVRGTEWSEEDKKCIIKKPEIYYFEAQPAAVFSGQSSYLKWRFHEDLADHCEIKSKLFIAPEEEEREHVVSIESTDHDGSYKVTPQGTTEYFMTCYKNNKEGETFKTMVSVIDLFIKER